jgi:hypothetical protein
MNKANTKTLDVLGVTYGTCVALLQHCKRYSEIISKYELIIIQFNALFVYKVSTSIIFQHFEVFNHNIKISFRRQSDNFSHTGLSFEVFMAVICQGQI